ncbi:MAG: hypothetical protein E1N59_3155 [Puniceicoccaceae bacterium 5H]|nr:MAG: hypothetical protein E1N59_3155 [Puniceicoccaceae bacterium 5H]
MSAITELVDLPPREQISLLRAGILPEVFDEVAQAYGLTREAFAQRLRISIRTLNRKKKEAARLGPTESERVLRAARLHHHARLVYATDEAAAQWLLTPAAPLGGAAPLDLSDTDVGMAQAESFIMGVGYGMFQ